SKMLGLAIDGITSLSIKPIRIITAIGVLTSFFSFALIIWVLWAKFSNNSVAGWASTYAIVSLLGGVQLISLGVIGEYIGKIYLEAKERPRYIIGERTYDENE
ncbi:MAG: glycosyltransferase, partial [Streptococcus sp.]|nr:glycosyltransferase [Streptococcus sp.]